MNEDQIRRIEEAINRYESRELYSQVRDEVEKEYKFLLIIISISTFLMGTVVGMLATFLLGTGG